MADYGIPVEDVEKYQKWTGYFLVDIKIVFIITYVYITVVNLISTTANNEANQFAENPMEFNVTSRAEHTNVVVNYIDDAVLWNCREHSLTRNYYATLYWMLLTMFIVTLLFYSASKCLAMWNITSSDSLNDLWHIGILQELKERIKKASYTEDCAQQHAEKYGKLLSESVPEKVYTEMKKKPIMIGRKLIPYCSLIVLVFALGLGALSYDLHLLSCIRGIPEDSINYDNATQTVELTFPGSINTFQQVGIFFTVFFAINLILLGCLFRIVTGKIVNKMEKKVKQEMRLPEESDV